MTSSFINIILVVHVFIAVGLVGLVLLQRSEGGALGIGGGGGGMMSARGAANALTRGTTLLAVLFFATSITLTILARVSAPRAIDVEAITGEPVQEESAPASDGSDLPALPSLPGMDLSPQPAEPAPTEADASGNAESGMAPVPTEDTAEPDTTSNAVTEESIGEVEQAGENGGQQP